MLGSFLCSVAWFLSLSHTVIPLCCKQTYTRSSAERASPELTCVGGEWGGEGRMSRFGHDCVNSVMFTRRERQRHWAGGKRGSGQSPCPFRPRLSQQHISPETTGVNMWWDWFITHCKLLGVLSPWNNHPILGSKTMCRYCIGRLLPPLAPYLCTDFSPSPKGVVTGTLVPWPFLRTCPSSSLLDAALSRWTLCS